MRRRTLLAAALSSTACGLSRQVLAGPNEVTATFDLPRGRKVSLLAGSDARAAVVENVHDPFFRRLSPLDFDLRLAEPVGDLPIDKRRERLFRL
ncbi:MAG: hypothetical protein ACRDD1_02020, partial [Planctomycetia bacterium]